MAYIIWDFLKMKHDELEVPFEPSIPNTKGVPSIFYIVDRLYVADKENILYLKSV